VFCIFTREESHVLILCGNVNLALIAVVIRLLNDARDNQGLNNDVFLRLFVMVCLATVGKRFGIG